MFGIGNKKKQTGKEVVATAVDGINKLVSDLDTGLTQIAEEREAIEANRVDAKKAFEEQDAQRKAKLDDLAVAAENGIKLKVNIANLLK